MTRPVKDRSGVGLPPKAERRAAGKLAAKKRTRAKRRKKILNRLAVVAVALAVLALLLFVAGVFDRGNGEPQASASPSAASSVDPALDTKAEVTAGTGELTELVVTPIITGTGSAVQSGQRVTVNYVGVNYATGEEFDSSWQRSEPFSFTIGNGEVIQGWDQGLLGVTVGSRVQLDIPSDLAYGDDPSRGATAGALRFVVDVLSAE